MPRRVILQNQTDTIARLLQLGKVEWVREAIEAGGQEIVAAVRRLAPGSIKDLLVVKMARDPKVALAWAGIDMKLSKKPEHKGKRNRYPYYVEYGTPAHQIQTVELKALKLTGGAFARVVNHPGAKGRGYFRRGVQSGRPRAKAVMESMLAQSIERLNASVAA